MANVPYGYINGIFNEKGIKKLPQDIQDNINLHLETKIISIKKATLKLLINVDWELYLPQLKQYRT